MQLLHLWKAGWATTRPFLQRLTLRVMCAHCAWHLPSRREGCVLALALARCRGHTPFVFFPFFTRLFFFLSFLPGHFLKKAFLGTSLLTTHVSLSTNSIFLGRERRRCLQSYQGQVVPGASGLTLDPLVSWWMKQ